MKISITKQIICIARQSQLCIGDRLSPFGITAAEEPFFMAIQRHENATQEELTAMVGVDKAATARAIRSLESKGFLVRKQDQKDRRQNRVCGTAAAHEIAEAVHGELLRLNGEIMKGLSEQEQAFLSKALTVMEKNLMTIRGRGDNGA